MVVHTRHYHNVAIVGVNGRLDALTSSFLAHAINEQITAGYHCLVVDLQHVDYLNSAAIKVLAQSALTVRQLGGDLRLAHARAHVKYVLHLASVESVIRLYPHVVGATASYFPSPHSPTPST